MDWNILIVLLIAAPSFLLGLWLGSITQICSDAPADAEPYNEWEESYMEVIQRGKVEAKDEGSSPRKQLDWM